MLNTIDDGDNASLTMQRESGYIWGPADAFPYGTIATHDGAEQRVRLLSDQELGRIFALITDPRNRALLAVMACGGLRMREVSLLDVQSVMERGEAGGLLLVPQAGRDTARLVPLGPWAFGIVLEYLQAAGRGLGSDGPLFLTRESADPGVAEASERLPVASIAMVVMRTLTLAEVADVVAGESSRPLTIPEVLRHTFVARYMRAGGRLLKLQALLGHRSITQTRHYVRRLMGPGAAA